MPISLNAAKEAISAQIVGKMDQGLIRDTPGAVVDETNLLTGEIIVKISNKHATKNDKRNGFTQITAASIVEDELTEELRNPE